MYMESDKDLRNRGEQIEAVVTNEASKTGFKVIQTGAVAPSYKPIQLSKSLH